ncbi:MAG TPA: SDR family oxidoreductase [Bacteroidota bacterium]
MKVLFIGGTGNISTAVSRLCVARGIDLTLLNRGTRGPEIPGTKSLRGDIADPDRLAALLAGEQWDVVVDWIAFTVGDVERDLTLFRRATAQYIFISSASAYEKPPSRPVITESTPLVNPFWEYSRNKIACEERLLRAYTEERFPVTIVRPSHTYDTVIPVAFGGWTDFTIIDRIRRGRKIIVHGDGTSLWTVTHAEDFAVGFVGLLGLARAIGEVFHITSDELLTWNQIYDAVARAAGEAPQIIHIPTDFIVRCEPSLRGPLFGDKSHSVIFDNSKIKRFVPDFDAVIPFANGIKRTLAWFDAAPQRRVMRPETAAMLDGIIASYERGGPVPHRTR